MHAVSIAHDSQAILGESPFWSRSRARLLWVDTFGSSFNTFAPATGQNIKQIMVGPIGFVTETATNEMIFGIGCDVVTKNRSGQLQTIATAPHAQAGYRLNDARLDSFGRLWVGLMDEALQEGSGYLYRLDPDGVWHIIDSGFTLINGLAFSGDSKTLYVTDSRTGIIYAYQLDPASGQINDRRVFVAIDPDQGKPDGLTIDHEGFLLSVLFDGAAIARISPAADIVQMITLPVPRPTSCAFDDSHRQLFVTSARLGLSMKQLEQAPASGSLLKIDYQQAVLS
ncbi:MAG: SMP-30/gluconolactonase/LRE family protein [Advenella sp.]|uniref:Transcriptional regulator, IclR family protein n=1 Tax=Advenella kashmirensis TaxID=310575 RepID=A0A356LF58_9BURK|nr:SMP-30/gluconolactonase/LRE family protein [Advenella sp. FME57]HBP29616.1 transcriptional regulator, IclR family protein [Advenella kashmirensis]